MKELTIISGKGGSGKTSLTASFAALAHQHILVDADVDAADLHLVLTPTIKRTEYFKGGYKAAIDLSICTLCNICRERCQFDAINPEFVVDPLRCEGCGVCHYFCPVGAVIFEQKTCGQWFESDTPYGPMVHARLGIAEENSGMLVSLLRKEARVLAGQRRLETIIIDGPPGIGCPVISSITGADAVLIITEPTLSGIHDMERVHQLATFLRVPAMVCINKADINPAMSSRIRVYAEENRLEYLGSIPYDREVTAAMVAGQPLVAYSRGDAAEAVSQIWEKVEAFLSRVFLKIHPIASNRRPAAPSNS
jgi:MinD superfamily P-loop ATPase